MAEIPEIEMPESSKSTEPFFRMNFAQALTVGSVVLGMLWAVFGYGRDISDNAKRIEAVQQSMATTVENLAKEMRASNEDTKRRMDSLEIYIRSIDRDGTQYGKGQLVNRTNEQEATVRRVEKLEENFNKLLPAVTQMGVNLEWITGWVKVQSLQPSERTTTHK